MEREPGRWVNLDWVCEHCGPIDHKPTRINGTTWCKACTTTILAEANGND